MMKRLMVPPHPASPECAVFDSPGHSEAWGPAGGMSMADLDADGRYEVIHWSENGLRILEGATGSVLAENVDVTTRALASEPVIADVDGDGSAEIVITGDLGDGER